MVIKRYFYAASNTVPRAHIEHLLIIQKPVFCQNIRLHHCRLNNHFHHRKSILLVCIGIHNCIARRHSKCSYHCYIEIYRSNILFYRNILLHHCHLNNHFHHRKSNLLVCMVSHNRIAHHHSKCSHHSYIEIYRSNILELYK